MNRSLIAILVVTLSLAASVSCVRPAEGGAETDRPTVEAMLGLTLSQDTRTWIMDDGESVGWSVGDKIALWARDDAGRMVVEAAPFTLRHFTASYATAMFAGRIERMPEADYDYFMAYPVPQSLSGTAATYSVPEVQDGRYAGAGDVMIASPVENTAAITSVKAPEWRVSMHHMMHALRITIPEGRNLFGYRFTRLEIVFPQPVAGDVTFDVTDPDAAPQIDAKSNRLVIENADGFDAGDTIWAFVLPTAEGIDGEITYRVSNDRRHSVDATYPARFALASGHVTPIRMATPDLYRYTSFEFRVPENNLGEDYSKLYIYDGAGQPVASFDRNEENVYKLEYEGVFDRPDWDGADFTLSFESEHAIVSRKINLGAVEPYASYSYTTSVPYLLEERFDNIGDFTDGHDNPGVGGVTSDSYTGSMMFDRNGLVGWSGCRVGGLARTSIRVCCRTQCTIFNNKYRYHGRLDSPRLTGIKPGVSVDVEVELDYGGGHAGNSAIRPIAVYGYDTSSAGAIDGKQHDTSWFIEGATRFDPWTESDASFETPHHAAYTLRGATDQYRLSWEVNSTGYANATNANGWLYLDNITVRIKSAQ